MAVDPRLLALNLLMRNANGQNTIGQQTQTSVNTTPFSYQGNIDLTHRTPWRMHDGSMATILSASFNDGNGHEVLVPTIDENGTLLSNSEAWQRYGQTGKNLGVFQSPQQADSYAQKLHDAENQRIQSWKGPIGNAHVGLGLSATRDAVPYQPSATTGQSMLGSSMRQRALENMAAQRRRY